MRRPLPSISSPRAAAAAAAIEVGGAGKKRTPTAIGEELPRFDKAAAAREELEKLLKNAVTEHEEDITLNQQKEEIARAGSGWKKGPAIKGPSFSYSFEKKDQAEKEDETEMMRKILEDMRHPGYGESIQRSLDALSGNVEGAKTMEQLMQQMSCKAPQQREGEEEGADVDFVISSMMRQMSEIPKHMPGMEVGAVEQAGEDIMTSTIAEFERFSEKEDFANFIESNLRQLLSKEIMYVPVKKICEKFPEWLAIQEENLPPDEYIRFGRQYQQFQKMVACFETEPDNFPRLVEIMYDIQDYGTPPADILKELASGLQFNQEGLPLMPNLGGNLMMPHMPNVPFPETNNCHIS